LSEWVFDPDGLEANRQGRLTDAQRLAVRLKMQRWLVSAMFTMAFGLLVVFALPGWLPYALGLPVAVVVVYMASRGYDCSRDSVDRRVAAVNTGFTRYPIARESQDRGWQPITVHGRRLLVPPMEEGGQPVPEMTIYFTPRAMIVVNVEPIHSPETATGPAAQVGC